MQLLKNLIFCLLTLSFRNNKTEEIVTTKREVKVMEDLIRVPVVIFNMAPIGTLSVWALQTLDEANSGCQIFREVYWRDAASPQGYGPFVSISAALEHHKWVINTCKGALPSTEPGKVIRVDFQNKRRVD